jgi:hypothetical protein
MSHLPDGPLARPLTRRTLVVGATGLALALSLRTARAEPPAGVATAPSEVLYPHDSLFPEA